MKTQLIINGKEISNPVVKYLLLFAAIFLSAIITLVILFIILPLIGIAATLSIGLIVSISIAVIISIPALIIFALVFNRVFGTTEVRIIQQHDHHD